MKRVVSISLGNSSRDHCVQTTICGEDLHLERIGTDGDQQQARRLFQKLDGEVDAFGFGGGDLGVEVNGRIYPLYACRKLVQGIRTPVVDGSGVRALVERCIAQQLASRLPPIQPKQVFFPVGVSRYTMVRSFVDAGYRILLGDLAIGLEVPYFIRSLRTLHLLAGLILPVVTRLPYEWFYPTGEEQEKIVPKYEHAYQWASVIAGDFHYIKAHLPDRLEGKVIVTNTTTAGDLEQLRRRGVSHLVTVTPRLAGRSFGTNVIEAALTAVAGKGRPLAPNELADMGGRDDLAPTVLAL